MRRACERKPSGSGRSKSGRVYGSRTSAQWPSVIAGGDGAGGAPNGGVSRKGGVTEGATTRAGEMTDAVGGGTGASPRHQSAKGAGTARGAADFSGGGAAFQLLNRAECGGLSGYPGHNGSSRGV